MTPIADMVERMMAAGVAADIIVLAVRTAEVQRPVEIPQNSADVSAERRRQRDRERKRQRKLSAENPQNSAENPQNSLARVEENITSSFLSSSSKTKEEKKEEKNPSKSGIPRKTHQPLSRSTISEEFQKFYEAFPRHVGKKAARNAYERALRETSPGHILEALEKQRPNWTEPKFIPHPATWLNRGQWDDEPVLFGTGPPSSEPEAPIGWKPGMPTHEELLRKYGKSNASGNHQPNGQSVVREGEQVHRRTAGEGREEEPPDAEHRVRRA